MVGSGFWKWCCNDRGVTGRHLASGTCWPGIDGSGAGVVGTAWRIPDVDYLGLAVAGRNVRVCSAGSALGVLSTEGLEVGDSRSAVDRSQLLWSEGCHQCEDERERSR